MYLIPTKIYSIETSIDAIRRDQAQWMNFAADVCYEKLMVVVSIVTSIAK